MLLRCKVPSKTSSKHLENNKGVDNTDIHILKNQPESITGKVIQLCQ